MKTRILEIHLSEDAAERYDDAVNGTDDDVGLIVEKVILARLYPGRTDALAMLAGAYIDTDPELVDVRHP